MILLTRAFPVAILALPLTVSFIRLGLYDTPLGVSLMHTALALPFAVLVSASLFQAIPREFEERPGCSAARGSPPSSVLSSRWPYQGSRRPRSLPL
jgi:hypothetical protein